MWSSGTGFLPGFDPGGGGTTQVFKETITTSDVPGTGTNIYNDGSSWIWHDTVSDRRFFVTRIGSEYSQVEAT